MVIKIKGVGLAAYAKLGGAILVTFTKKYGFEFESDISEREWMVAYYESCCSSHDSEVCNLRKLINTKGG